MLKLLNKKKIKRFIIQRILRRDLPISLVPQDYEIPVEAEVVEDFGGGNGKIPCNVNFDDLCPRYYDRHGLDFGGCPGQGVSLEFSRFLEDYPRVAVTIFVVPLCMIAKTNPWRSGQAKERYNISSSDHAEWLEYYKSLANTYNIEYAMHGCYHRQFDNLLFGRHAEFALKREAESLKAIATGLAIFRQAGVEVCGFRQPAWDINSDLSLCRALKKSGFRYIAGSSSDAGFNAGHKMVSNYYPTQVDGLPNFPQNVLLDWTFDRTREEIDKIVGLKGIISIKGHFVDRDMPNCLSGENVDKLRSILDYLSKEYRDKIEYLTFRELAQRI